MKKKYISPIIKIQYMSIEESILRENDFDNNDSTFTKEMIESNALIRSDKRSND